MDEVSVSVTSNKTDKKSTKMHANTREKNKSDVSIRNDIKHKNISKTPFTRQMIDKMIINSLNNLKEGTSSDDIIRYIEETYKVKMNLYKPYIKKFLSNGVGNGTLERVSEVTEQEKYKIKTLKTKSQHQNLGEKAATVPSTSETPKTHKRKAAEDTPRPSKKVSTETPVPNVSIDNSEPEKTASNVKIKAGNDKSMTTNDKGKMPKIVSAAENKNQEEKSAQPLISEMIVNSIKFLKKRNGANVEDIQKYVEGNYDVSRRALKSRLTKVLKKSVDDGVLDKLDGDDSKERYKIKKKTDKTRKDPKVVDRKRKLIKKASAQKKKDK